MKVYNLGYNWKGANFEDLVTFQGKADFGSVTFQGRAKFESASAVQGRADFGGATFKEAKLQSKMRSLRDRPPSTAFANLLRVKHTVQ